MRFLKGCLIFLALNLLFALAVAGAAAYFITRPPASVRDLPPPATSLEKAQALETKLDEFAQGMEQAGERKPLSLVITEDEASSLIARELPRFQEENPEAIPFQIDSPRVLFREGKVIATAVIDIQGFRPQVAVEARVSAQAGRPKIDIERIDLGRIPIPLLGLFQDYIGQALQALETEKLPLEVERVEITEGKLLLEGWSQPPAR